jgi:hypothetical protein
VLADVESSDSDVPAVAIQRREKPAKVCTDAVQHYSASVLVSLFKHCSCICHVGFPCHLSVLSSHSNPIRHLDCAMISLDVCVVCG